MSRSSSAPAAPATPAAVAPRRSDAATRASQPFWRSMRLRDAFVLSLPVVLALAYAVVAAVSDFRYAQQYDDFWARSRHVGDLFVARLRTLSNLPAALLIDHRLDPQDQAAAPVRIIVPRFAWDSIHESPAGWNVEIEADVLEGVGRNAPARYGVKLRKRGDTSVHYTTQKRSFTLQAKKDERYRGYRELAFSAKDVLPSYVANRMADEFGILSAFTTVAPVFVNDRFYGMFRVTGTIDESLLRKERRVSSYVFRGDVAERGERFRGVPWRLFGNPGLWKTSVAPDSGKAAPPPMLADFLRDLNGTTLADHERLMRRLDRDEMGRLLAYTLFFGDPYHMDDLHNQNWYQDPYRATLHPIAWDIRVMDVRRAGPVSQLTERVLRDPFVVDRALRTLHERVASRTMIAVADSLAREAEARYRDHFAYDRLRAGLIPDVGTPQEIVATLESNAKALAEWTADARVDYRATEAGAAAVLDFVTRGYAGNDLVAVDVAGSPASTPTVTLDRNGNGRLDADDPRVDGVWAGTGNGWRFAFDEPVALLSGWQARGVSRFEPSPVHYRLFLAGARGAITPVLRHRLTGKLTTPGALAAGATITASTSYSAWRFAAPRGKTIRLAGDVPVRETLRVGARDTLAIEPGTTLRMAAGASIVSRGLVLAEGTAARPIRVVAAGGKGAPWGTFALQDAGASRSRLAFVTFEHGAGATVDEIFYPAMVSVHYARGVAIDDATLAESAGGARGALHAVGADVTSRRSLWNASAGNAIDLEYSGGTFSDCRVYNSGKNGFDLMESSPRIERCAIAGARDKGLAIGEASSPVIVDSRIWLNRTGAQVRDRSEPLFLNDSIANNRVGIDQRRQKLRFGGGGWATVVNSIVSGNRDADVESDGESRLTTGGRVEIARMVRLDTLGELVPVRPAAGDAAGSLGWLYAQTGLRPAASRAGLLGDTARVAPAAPLAVERFDDVFGDLGAGWTPATQLTRVEKNDGSLTIAMENGLGVAVRRVRWDLSAQPAPATLALALSARDLQSASITLVSDRGRITRALPTTGDLATFGLVSIEVPAARYSAVEIEILPTAPSRRADGVGLVGLRTGRLDIRSMTLHGAAAPGGPAAAPRR